MTETRARAVLKNLDITPRKVRRVAQLLKGLHVDNALAELSVIRTRSAKPITKLIQSAIANAKEKKLDPNKLVVDSIRVDQGRTLKRLLPKGRGRAGLIRKRFSHLTVELTESEKEKSRGFVIPEKVRKVKERGGRRRPRPKSVALEAKPKEKKGFIQKVFRRKAV